jgi:hypothetical protein
MNLDRYEYSTNDTFLNFEFCSDGPNGKIKKLIRFSPQNVNGVTYFSLGFGDYNNDTNKVDDQVITNNQDKTKVLVTVAATVLEFTSYFPDMMVYAKGSTPARTRLYQMGIAANWLEIQSLLHVYGFINNQWQPFEKNVNYEAFLIQRKKL